jgi:hypothetical protein
MTAAEVEQFRVEERCGSVWLAVTSWTTDRPHVSGLLTSFERSNPNGFYRIAKQTA